MNAIQSSLIPLEVSEDKGLTWLQLICMSDYNVTMDSQTTDTNTQCGIAVGSGPIKFGATGTAVDDAAPAAGQVTWNKMLTWQVIKEEIMFRVQWPQGATGSHGSAFFIEGTGLVVKNDGKFTVGDVVKYNFEIKGTGLPIINA